MYIAGERCRETGEPMPMRALATLSGHRYTPVVHRLRVTELLALLVTNDRFVAYVSAGESFSRPMVVTIEIAAGPPDRQLVAR